MKYATTTIEVLRTTMCDLATDALVHASASGALPAGIELMYRSDGGSRPLAMLRVTWRDAAGEEQQDWAEVSVRAKHLTR